MHRAAFPNGKRPFEDLEPVMRAIESLDPEDDTPRYFRSARAPKSVSNYGALAAADAFGTIEDAT